MFSRRFVGVASGIGTVLAIFVTVLATAAPGNSHMQVRLTPADAINAVSPFAPATRLSVAGPYTGQGQVYFQVTGPDVSADVDANDGTVRMLTVPSAFPVDDTVKITRDDAQAVATSFVNSHTVTMSTGMPTVSLVDHGIVQEYLVEWQSIVNGALVPDYVSASINPTSGAVFGFSNFARPYAFPPKAQIDQATAEEHARGILEESKAWRVTSATLRVDFDDSGAQVLVWDVHLVDAASSAAFVRVDAMDGSAKVVAQG